MAYAFATLIVTAADASLARSIAASFGPGGEGMWTAELSFNGLGPATHYISTGYITKQFIDLAPCTTWEQEQNGVWVEVDYYPGDAESVYEQASQAGVQCSLSGIEGLFLRSDCSKQQPFVAIERLGLIIVNTEISP